MPNLGPTELIIILLIVVVVFGASRLKGIGGALGGSISEFKKAVREDDPPVTKVERVDLVEPSVTKVERVDRVEKSDRQI